jgi:hypothetical protein
MERPGLFHDYSPARAILGVVYAAQKKEGLTDAMSDNRYYVKYTESRETRGSQACLLSEL